MTAEYKYPQETEGPSRRELLGIRLACSAVIAGTIVLVFRTPLLEATAFLWPPTDPLSQWSFLVLLHVGGLVVLPLMIGSFLADRLYARYIAD